MEIWCATCSFARDGGLSAEVWLDREERNIGRSGSEGRGGIYGDANEGTNTTDSTGSATASTEEE